MEYFNEFHKESTIRCLKEIEEQKKMPLNAKEEAKRLFAMHKRIALQYPTNNKLRY